MLASEVPRKIRSRSLSCLLMISFSNNWPRRSQWLTRYLVYANTFTRISHASAPSFMLARTSISKPSPSALKKPVR